MVNKMHAMKCRDCMNLKRLHQLLDGILHTGALKCLCFLQALIATCVFHKGTIQILEGVPDDIVNTMCREFESRTKLKLPPMTISNLVLSARLKKKPCLLKIRHCDAHVFYDVELFPAALITYWKPAHVPLFHNGHIVVTAIKFLREGYRVLKHLMKMLQ